MLRIPDPRGFAEADGRAARRERAIRARSLLGNNLGVWVLGYELMNHPR